MVFLKHNKRAMQYGGWAAIAAAIVCAYWSGRHRGWQAGYRAAASNARASAFVASFDTLKKIRAGDMTNGITRLESFCFSSFVELVSYPGDKSNIVAWFRPELADYRSAYAPRSEEQYPTEKKLDELLRVTPERQ